jgi:hypothetical protein
MDFSLRMFLPILVCAVPCAAQERNDSVSLKQLERSDLIDFGSRLIAPAFSKADRDKDLEGKVHFSVIPIAPSRSGTGAISVSAINASFYTDKHSNVSTVYFYPYTNFTTSYGLLLSPYVWLSKNEWNGTGDFRILHNGMKDYGFGSRVPPIDFTIIRHSQFRAYFTGHTRVLENFYLGVGYNLDYFWGVGEEDPTPESPSEFQRYGIGTGPSSVSSGITFNILRDNRKNSVNPRNGHYTALVLRVNRKAMGSSSEWGSVFLDMRRYKSFSNTRHKILAGRVFYWGTYGDTPYLNLPTTLEDPSGRAGRGYLTNRFRGAQWVFSEAEYRFDISSGGFFGGVVFANLQSYTNRVGFFDDILGAAGFGLRLKFNRHSDTNLTFDFAYGKEGWNWYINLGEYF